MYNYESKFILDSFIFCVSPARFLKHLAANVDFSTRSRVYSYDLISQIKFLKWLAVIDFKFFTWSHDFSVCHGKSPIVWLRRTSSKCSSCHPPHLIPKSLTFYIKIPIHMLKKGFYKSKFILDSFIFCVSPAKFLRWVNDIVTFFPTVKPKLAVSLSHGSGLRFVMPKPLNVKVNMERYCWRWMRVSSRAAECATKRTLWGKP